MDERSQADVDDVDAAESVKAEARSGERLPGEGIQGTRDAGGQVGTSIREANPAGEQQGVTVRDPSPTVEEVGTTVRELPVDHDTTA